MIDERDLEQAERVFAPPEGSFDRFLRRRDRKRRNQRLAAGVVGIAVFAAAVWIVTSSGPFDRTQTPGATGPSVATGPTVPPASKRLSRSVEGISFSLSVPRSWIPGPITRLADGSGGLREGDLLISKSIMAPQGAEAVIFWTAFPDGDHADPCSNLVSSPVGPSAADLAAAVAAAPGTQLVEGPSDVTVGGYPAKHVMLTVRDDSWCEPGFFYTWRSECWGPCWMETKRDDTIEVWIVDVVGMRLFIEAETTPQADSDLKQEIQQIVGSIRFGDTPTTFPGAPEVDYLLDLNTGEMTPLPEGIVGTEDLTAGYAVSPDGSEVAYYGRAGDGSVQVFVANLDGTHVRQITLNASAQLIWSGSPGWSPDGTKIAYVGHPTGDVTRKGFVIDLASGVTTQVTFDTEEVESIQFSPDGSSILYTASDLATGDGKRVIRIVPVAGGEGSTLADGDRTWDGWQVPADAQLSPDGSLLSYICAPGPDVCLANADGSGARVLASADDAIMSARWSPDGTRIAYWVFHPVNVRVVDVATGAASYVTEGALPVWLNDHTLIVEHDRCPGPGSDGCGG